MKQLFTIGLLFFSIFSMAQDVQLSKNQLNIHLTGFSYEGKISENKSFTLGAGLGISGVTEKDAFNGETKSYFYALPVFSGSFRKYYTRKRVNKNNLRNNSGNYVGLYGNYQLEPFGNPSNATEALAYRKATNVYAVGPVWGFERNYASGIHLGLNMGIGMVGGKYIKNKARFIGEFSLGFVLFSK